jgi:hypothetical protein
MSRVDSDTAHGFKDLDVLSLKTVSRGFGLADDCGDLIKMSFGLSQLAIDNAQASNRQAHVDVGCFNEAAGTLMSKTR